MLRYQFSLVLAIVLISGCVSNPSYPIGWLPIRSDVVCSQIAGIYKDSGVNQDGYSLSLNYLFFREVNSVNSEVTLIYFNEEKVIFDFYYQDMRLGRKFIDIDSRGCHGHMLEFSSENDEGGVNREGVIGYEWSKFRIFIDADANLIVNRKSTGVMFALFFPVFGVSSSWYKFDRIME